MDEDDDRDLPNMVRAWRLYKGMSLGKLAAELGTSKSQVSALETTDRLSVSWMHRIARILKCEPGWLVDMHPHDAFVKIHSATRAATPSVRDQIAAVAETMAKYSPAEERPDVSP